MTHKSFKIDPQLSLTLWDMGRGTYAFPGADVKKRTVRVKLRAWNGCV